MLKTSSKVLRTTNWSKAINNKINQNKNRKTHPLTQPPFTRYFFPHSKLEDHLKYSINSNCWSLSLKLEGVICFKQVLFGFVGDILRSINLKFERVWRGFKGVSVKFQIEVEDQHLGIVSLSPRNTQLWIWGTKWTPNEILSVDLGS